MLRDRAWKRFPQGYDDEMITELYEPALAVAVGYDRSCAYFSSSVLAAAARGFGGLIQNLLALGDEAPRPAVRLIVNEQLASEDVDALLGKGDPTVLEAQLAERLADPVTGLEKARLEMLAYLVARGLVDVKVGIMRKGNGIMHAKFGLITDATGDTVVFAGSSNESRSGLQFNFENLEVSTSWHDPERRDAFRHQFELLWSGQHGSVATVALPDAVKQNLIQMAPELPPAEPKTHHLARQTALMRLRYVLEAPFMSGGGDSMDALAPVKLWPHQRGVVIDTAQAWPEGRLLCDEVGMGKTLEAIMSLRRLLAGQGVGRALILVPAGLLIQWQGELREKGGLIIPRLEGDILVWPNGHTRKTTLPHALDESLLLMSREAARLPHNRETILSGATWDLVILDESHAARRKNVSQEGEYNSASLLLTLLRELQLRQKSRSVLLLSATPMQTHAWEPWDLLAVLGEGGPWLAEFEAVRRLYDAATALERHGRMSKERAEYLAHLIAQDPLFGPCPELIPDPTDKAHVADTLYWPPAGRTSDLVQWLRERSPLGRRMHRNTRDTLREYRRLGLTDHTPTTRAVKDVVYEFLNPAERETYDQVTAYINRRFQALPAEDKRSAKGFVLTVYRRRAASSLYALTNSLERRAEGLRTVLNPSLQTVDVAFDAEDLLDAEDLNFDVSASFPTSAAQAKAELKDLEPLLGRLRALGGVDSKFEQLRVVLGDITKDQRSVLIFTQYADTMRYLRTELARDYSNAVASYSGEGGSIYRQGKWQSITKDDVTRLLREGQIQFLICTDAASEGLNLQAAGAIVNYDLPWNPSRVEQRIGRVDRIGQKLPTVSITNLYLKDSVDDAVYRALRKRCGLFEHFVGEMQPVLARARRMLDGSEVVSVKELEAEADDLQQDSVRRAAYRASHVPKVPGADPAVTLSGLFEVLSTLPVEAGVAVAGEHLLDLGGHRYSKDVSALEHDAALRPLSVLDPDLRKVPNTLEQPGERLPLVFAAAQEGAFRRTALLWIDGDTWSPVMDLKTLEEHLKSWQGETPDPQVWLAAVKAAQAQVEEEVKGLAARATELGTDMLARQRQAAQLRLTGHLGKLLVCYNPHFSDLNKVFYAQMQGGREPSVVRLQRVYERVGYPNWSPVDVTDLKLYAKTLKPQDQKTRLTGKQIDAALADPRWGGAAP